MALKCENCGAANPAINLHCGQCGTRLEPSADLSPEVIDFDNQMPLLVGEGSDRRIHPPPEMVEQVHDFLEHEAKLHDELQHGSELHHELRAKQAVRADFLRWKIDHFDEKAFFPDIPTDEGSADPPPSHHDVLPAGERASGTGVSGPSFLGLSDDRVPNFDYEEPEANAHLRRNIAIGVVAAVVVLAAVQWRSIRDYGLPYVKNGSMASAQRDPQNSPPMAANNAGRDLGSGTASSKVDSSPAVKSGPTPKPSLKVQQAATTRQPAPPAPRAQVMRPRRPPAMSAPTADVPRNDQSKSPTYASRSRAKPRRSPAQPFARSVSHNVPGSDEMKRAVNASDAEARAAWLWKAVSKGNPEAPVELAGMYERGSGVVRSCDQAKVLLRSAAAKDNAQAKLRLQQIRIRGGCSTR